MREVASEVTGEPGGNGEVKSGWGPGVEGQCHHRQLGVGNEPSQLSSLSTLELRDLSQRVSTSLLAIEEKKMPKLPGKAQHIKNTVCVTP